MVCLGHGDCRIPPHFQILSKQNTQQKKPRHRSLGTAAYRLLVVQKKKRVTEIRES
jgi:hypothetical protein